MLGVIKKSGLRTVERKEDTTVAANVTLLWLDATIPNLAGRAWLVRMRLDDFEIEVLVSYL
ncbi:hypothetical protein DPV78_000718 [Talaromyces pinophilus]|jgi:hypothetical protein|nr:hypothetical protein DPV78_000718 [Talaromyces pinophilus]